MSERTTAVRTAAGELTEAEAIETYLSTAYGSTMHIRSDLDEPLLRYSAADAGAFALDSLRQSAVLDFRVDPMGKGADRSHDRGPS